MDKLPADARDALHAGLKFCVAVFHGSEDEDYVGYVEELKYRVFARSMTDLVEDAASGVLAVIVDRAEAGRPFVWPSDEEAAGCAAAAAAGCQPSAVVPVIVKGDPSPRSSEAKKLQGQRH
eukprot:GHUV01038646.1.p1 GENE.GHUV01038646.1~~GHUV01038646.1.p1  ORF type:complete len:121 (+),score=11.95 GHUV01038646.1:407-769(+)